MQNTKLPILGFAAQSGTGKTTLLCQLIPLLTQQGIRIGLIKHSHHDFQIDIEGKDSFRLRAAGASPVLLISPVRRAMMTEIAPAIEVDLNTELAHLDQSGLDLILVEGFRSAAFPKIELHRSSLNQPLLFPNDVHIIAVASDTPLSLPKHLIALELNNPHEIAHFIHYHFMTKP